MIKVMQTCNGCKSWRTLNLTDGVLSYAEDIRRAGTRQGWAEVGKNKHLCPTCVKEVTKK